ncbi:hypothetical protein E2C01_046163 [Portunus trituberculatus]|uniref:Uncharacterized protein n=1 Tax=Portunus trituberculatus TaxID=210409 RepID=A0A5B7G424_PORTR|nr:hypothetical protein [Portunus trituberculatus]
MSSPTPNAPIQHPANRRPPLRSATWDHVSSVTITKSTTSLPRKSQEVQEHLEETLPTILGVLNPSCIQDFSIFFSLRKSISRSRRGKTVKHRTSISQDNCRVRREKYVNLSSSSWLSGMGITAGINWLSNNLFVKLNRWAPQVGLDGNTLARILELPILN